jgi:FKBP-type peptidyl-prolyl cis-trans isomerase (trigger factor)
LLISIPWGNTNLKLDNCQTISIPRQMLQAQQSQIVHQYQQHCHEIGIDSMSDRTVYSILESIHASEQKFISGVDDFVKAASEGWSILNK